jgi:hypothetical protein
MQFTLGHTPDVINQHVDVQIVVGGGQLIVRVSTDLDSFNLAADTLSPPSVQYERSFNQVGTRSPGLTHKLVVTAQDESGNEESSTKIWRDEN